VRRVTMFLTIIDGQRGYSSFLGMESKLQGPSLELSGRSVEGCSGGEPLGSFIVEYSCLEADGRSAIVFLN